MKIHCTKIDEYAWTDFGDHRSKGELHICRKNLNWYFDFHNPERPAQVGKFILPNEAGSSLVASMIELMTADERKDLVKTIEKKDQQPG